MEESEDTSHKMKTYSARYDVWLLVALTAVLFAGIIGGFELMQSNLAAGLLMYGVLVVIFLIFLVYGIPCEYYLDEDSLRVRSGLRFWSISYADITAVEKSPVILPTPAWSLKRVDIVSHRGTLQLSPEKRESFIEELSERVAKAKSEGTSR